MPVTFQQMDGSGLQRAETAKVVGVADALATERGQIFWWKLCSPKVEWNQFFSGGPDVNIEIDHYQVVKNGDVCRHIFSPHGSLVSCKLRL